VQSGGSSMDPLSVLVNATNAMGIDEI
jgi:hypothetical protein